MCVYVLYIQWCYINVYQHVIYVFILIYKRMRSLPTLLQFSVILHSVHGICTAGVGSNYRLSIIYTAEFEQSNEKSIRVFDFDLFFFWYECTYIGISSSFPQRIWGGSRQLMELHWIILSRSSSSHQEQQQKHDCRFGCGNSSTPAADTNVGLFGFCHRRHRTRHRPLALQRRENVQSEIQSNRRSRTRISIQIHSQRTLDTLLHQSYEYI